MGPTARIRLFGVPRIEHVGSSPRATRVTLTETSAAVLAYLLLNGRRSHNRSALTWRFWGDSPEDAARACFNTTVWRLRQALEPVGVERGTFLSAPTKDSLGFNWESSWWLDALELERCVERTIAGGGMDVKRLEAAVDLYAAPFLEGHRDGWVSRERDRFEMLHLEGLGLLLQGYARSGDHRSALACGRQILYADPLREDVHRTMMAVYAERGQRSMVVRQYRWCASVLAEELSIQPMAETDALYEQLVGRSARTGPAPVTMAAANGWPRSFPRRAATRPRACHNVSQTE